MSASSQVEEKPIITDSIEHWFETPLGRYLARQEQAYFDAAVADLFGYYAVQVGIPTLPLLRHNRMPHRIVLGTQHIPADLRADPCFLPFANASIDLLVLPHVFEFSNAPHQILREVERVLMPEGHVLISGFNPLSLWGLFKLWRNRDTYPWNGNFISLPRIKDWLALLGMDVNGGRLGCYAPPFEQAKWLNRFAFMELAGDRWWPVSCGVYYVQAVKRVHGMRLISPRWHQRLRRPRNLVTALDKQPTTVDFKNQC